MDLTITAIFYLVVGCGVGIAFALREREPTRLSLLIKPLVAALFWPLFVPLLLESAHRKPLTLEEMLHPRARSSDDSLCRAIEQVELELDAALRSLAGWPGAALKVEHNCFDELRSAWRVQADRVRELDRLLGDSEFCATAAVEAQGGSEARTHNEQTRQENIEKLKTIRDRLRHDLLGTIAWVRELVTMIHLAKYTGAPASRAEELVRQIATAVEGLTQAANPTAA